jgi:hypothetical protein
MLIIVPYAVLLCIRRSSLLLVNPRGLKIEVV